MKTTETHNLIKEILDKLPVSYGDISINEDGSKTTWFSIEVGDPYPFLDRGGEGVFALNHLIRKITDTKSSREEANDHAIIIDINGFQKKRVESVRSIAHMMAERARYFKSNIEIDPMPAFERRVIHEFLSEAGDLKTESQGEGHSRRVVIKYVGDL
ncbi:MAG TPA: R3H domain-containing nucleic acid-binding protein [Candidatus Paceibacterota bacterium]|nr:R3H domain-containing nucleic acid-binding protein [Candidatus Paceibacterota bacterium]